MAEYPTYEDFDQYFNLENADLSRDSDQSLATLGLGCHLHPTEPCLCHEAFNIADTAYPGNTQTMLDMIKPSAGLEAFPSYIPRYSKPEKYCDYCSSRHLECYIIEAAHGDSNCCAPCKTLFRRCSLAVDYTGAHPTPGRLDTLHVVDEDTCQETGHLTSSKPLLTLGANFHDMLDSAIDTNPARSFARFSKSTTQIVRKWLDDHSENPYPTDAEKDELQVQTGLTRTQIQNYLANARRRGKVRAKNSVSASFSSSSGSSPIAIPGGRNTRDRSRKTPFERFLESPPEHEAPLSMIKRAAANTSFNAHDSGESSGAPSLDILRSSIEDSSLWQRDPSLSSLETGRSSSFNSHGSVLSRGSRSSYSSFAHKERRRRRRTAPIPHRASGIITDTPLRPFKCTFCTDTFATKYDWTRHEKSLHLSIESWICCPDGPVLLIVDDNGDPASQCAYCSTLNPSVAHLETHNHSACAEKDASGRCFSRKDHLRQHLRLVHFSQLEQSMEGWRRSATVLRSRCGFCDAAFVSWTQRADHLAGHFRSGTTMASWKGSWGFDEDVLIGVRDAMLPYLIASEACTLVPFSATDNLWGGSGSKTCWVEMTAGLGLKVGQWNAEGRVVTDEMLQEEAKTIVYGEADEWNQTEADNHEWLQSFKMSHGLGQKSMFDDCLLSGFQPNLEIGFGEMELGF